ncbi:MAG: SPASM domain-containing protein [Candidatus Mcinerneyibacterium aminivorans]|uniref:SPASM domain-containing protein n=1 Tax=Candidatus Mcinerneyibacterium aminivorans TaxID=2703815 RepID=A0A5D0M9W5_9BACT|nr:MAG: SPASM domain-containing protein [Candidatus Mcinerneyibacterium aminivorans]
MDLDGIALINDKKLLEKIKNIISQNDIFSDFKFLKDSKKNRRKINREKPRVLILENELRNSRGVEFRSNLTYKPFTIFISNSLKLAKEADDKKNNLTITNKQYYEFLNGIIEILFDREYVNIQFENAFDLIKGLFGGKASRCAYSRNCFRSFFISYEGDVTICSRFLGEDKFILGNIHNESLIQILSKTKTKNIINKYEKTPHKCKNCNYFTICKSGCSHLRAMNDWKEQIYCEATCQILNKLWEKIQYKLGKSLGKWNREKGKKAKEILEDRNSERIVKK